MVSAQSGHPAARARQAARLGVPLALGWALGLAVVASVGVLAFTRHGPLLSPDSMTYLSAARNLTAGNGYSDFTGEALVHFPPGLPVVLAFWNWLGIDMLTGARIVNAIAFAATVLLAYALLRRHVTSTWVTVGALGAVALSPRLLYVFGHVWSEVLFLPLILVFLLLLDHIAERARRPDLVIALAALVAGVAFLVRYAALPLFVVGAVVVVVTFARDGFRSLARHVATFALVAAVLPGFWIIRNAVSGTGDARIPAHVGLVTLVRGTASAFGRPFVPYRGTQTVGLLLLITLVLLGAATLIVYRRPLLAALRSNDGLALFPPLIFLVVYLVFVMVSRRLTGSYIDQRIVAPLYVPTVFLGAWTLDRVFRVAPRHPTPVLVRALAVVGIAWVATLAVSFLDDARDDGGQGLDRSAATDASILAAIDDVDDQSLIVSDDPFVVSFETEHQPILRSPGPIAPGMSHFPLSVEELTERVVCSASPTYLLWFGSAPEDELKRPSELREDFDLEVVERARDGTLYRITVPNSASPTCGA